MSKQISPIQDIKNNLERMAPEFEKALPPHIPVKKFVRVVQTAITTTPSLLNSNRSSLWAACTKAAEASLMPNGVEAALVPYKDKVQFMPMVAGLLKLARNSGEILSITSQIVYENDQFDYGITEQGEMLSHKPNLFQERGKMLAVYALAKTKDGGVYIEVITAGQLKDIESSSRGKNTPWNGPFRSEMIKKSAIKRLCKRLPSSTDLENSLEADNSFYELEAKEIREATKEEFVKNKPSRLKKLIEKPKDIEQETDKVIIDKKENDVI